MPDWTSMDVGLCGPLDFVLSLRGLPSDKQIAGHLLVSN